MKIPNLKLDKEFRYLLKKHGFIVNNQGYVVANIKGTVTHLHRIVLGDKEGFEIDHINHDKLDNRRINLRHVTHQQNMWNMKMCKRNRSGFTGVAFNNEIRKWVARIYTNGKSIHLGSFADIKDAIKTRKNAESIYFQT